MSEHQWKNLKYVVRPKSSASKTAVIMIHGFGANAYDLYPLADALDPSGQSDWFFPDGVVQVDIGGGMSGRAWFPIDMEAFALAMQTGQARDLSQTKKGVYEGAMNLLIQWLVEISSDYEEIIIGGFSQGAMLTSHIVPRFKDQKLKSFVLLSSNPAGVEDWKSAVSETEFRPSFFQSHGKSDAVLDFDYAKNQFQLLEDSGYFGEWVEFSGGHEIPPKVLQNLRRFIDSSWSRK